MNVAQAASQPAQQQTSSLPQNSDNASTTPLPDVTINNAAQDQGVTGVISPTSASLQVPAPPPAAAVPSIDTGVNAPIAKPSQPLPSPSQANGPAATPTSAVATVLVKARLPNDRVGILEDRIAEDPRGDMEAWLELISEHRKRNKLSEARAVYDRFFEVFPHAAEQWVAYAKMESDADAFYQLEQIFQRSLMSVPHVKLWSTYLDYVRRRNNLTTDTSGNARQIVSQAFEFVLQNVGIDRDSGHIWQDYIDFIKSGPGTVGGTSWQDQQKMDQLRKAYQRAVVVPTHATNTIWNEYSKFEMDLNKNTGRKFLQEKSPAFVTARSSAVAMANFTRELQRTTLPKLPPAHGFDGDVEYMRQVELWKHWINWEKDDPLVIREEDPAAYKNRLVYVYKHALMALRFWPEIWFDAAEFCFENDIKDASGKEQSKVFLEQGVTANPESLLLAFKQADSVEIAMANESGDGALKRRGDAVREVYNKALDALYGLVKKTDARKSQAIARAKEQAEWEAEDAPEVMQVEDDDEYQPNGDASKKKEEALQRQIDAIQKGAKAETDLLKKLITSAWVGLMRAMRRIQGKGKIGEDIGGSRQVFADARKRGWITSEVYVASALMEYHSYKDPAATRILEKGVRLYPEDEYFALEYLKHLIAINDVTNARAVFETTVSRLASKPETLDKAKPLYAYFHEYESQYGELSQVIKLEKRMADLWPSEPQIQLFAHRFSAPSFDPTSARPIISPATQAKPKAFAMPSIETTKPASITNSPRQALAHFAATSSPKRPFPHDESDNEMQRPRKFAREESPLKGAAGRRLDASRRNKDGNITPMVAQPTLPRDIMFLLRIIPGADKYDVLKFSPERMVELIRSLDLSRVQV
ncbi:Suf-domain-containing protein [Rhizodiscina lignyota]|uniref:mRNA 3'-end-processing protein RNA14 n=1 Tax=Rhizodiscina lignyota TaxID=1504668 RepID=A0A9P4I886_9PEZI|nr:Suf-domain-containing protein [Rhizodiscina lignyota]